MISRNDRNDVADLITAFLSGKLDESDIPTWQRIETSKDMTVKYACEILDGYIEGYESEVCLMEKSEWDHLERIRLVLLSDAELRINPKNKYGIRQLLGFTGIVATALLVVMTGFGWHLLIGTSIIGFLILACCHLLLRPAESASPYKPMMAPFESIEQLATIYESTPSFRKVRFPKQWRTPTGDWGLLSWIISSTWMVVCTLVSLLLSPVLLLILALPDCEREFTVINH